VIDPSDPTGFLTGVSSVAAGGNMTLAIKSVDGTVRAWGSGSFLGTGARSAASSKPVKVILLAGVAQVAAGALQALARKDDTVWSWGPNDFGNLGDGTNVTRFAPVQVRNPDDPSGFLTGVTAVASTNVSSLALLSDGTVRGWGMNSGGQLCDGTKIDRWRPVPFLDGSDGGGRLGGITAVAEGVAFSMALRDDGTVWTCGANGSGQLGDGTSTERLTAVQVAGLTRVVAIAAGNSFGLALLDDGTVRAWGAGASGQLGDGALSSSSVPVQVADPDDPRGVLGGVVAIAAGGGHALALKNDGRVVAWGLNDVGQLGDGSEPYALTPVHVRF
jgi:alpha-tubulin suppressor-like RCC1 family protein